MDSEIKEVSQADLLLNKFEALKTAVDAWQQTVQFNLTLTWTILGITLAFVIAAAGWALSVLARDFAEKSVNKKMADLEIKITDNLLKKLINEPDKIPLHWVNGVLLNGWATDENDPFIYSKDLLGFVNLEGILSNGKFEDGRVVTNLPEGYRPNNRKIFPVMCFWGKNRELCELVVESSGDIIINGQARGKVALNGIRFVAKK